VRLAYQSSIEPQFAGTGTSDTTGKCQSYNDLRSCAPSYLWIHKTKSYSPSATAQGVLQLDALGKRIRLNGLKSCINNSLNIEANIRAAEGGRRGRPGTAGHTVGAPRQQGSRPSRRTIAFFHHHSHNSEESICRRQIRTLTGPTWTSVRGYGMT
jgi:hypothetical protein